MEYNATGSAVTVTQWKVNGWGYVPGIGSLVGLGRIIYGLGVVLIHGIIAPIWNRCVSSDKYRITAVQPGWTGMGYVKRDALGNKVLGTGEMVEYGLGQVCRGVVELIPLVGGRICAGWDSEPR